LAIIATVWLLVALNMRLSSFCALYLKTEYSIGFLMQETLQKHAVFKFLKCLVKKYTLSQKKTVPLLFLL